MFHEKPNKGGLGVPEFETSIADHLSKLKVKMYSKQGLWSFVASKIKVPLSQRARRKDIIESCDGRGLAESMKKPGCYSWIADGTRLMKGAEYIEALKTRPNLIGTKERQNRGKDIPLRNLVCDLGCPRIETTGHILQ